MDYTHQAPLPLEFSRQEYWSGVPLPTPGYLPNPAIKTLFLASPALAGWFITTSVTWEAYIQARSLSLSIYIYIYTHTHTHTHTHTDAYTLAFIIIIDYT